MNMCIYVYVYINIDPTPHEESQGAHHGTQKYQPHTGIIWGLGYKSMNTGSMQGLDSTSGLGFSKCQGSGLVLFR